MIDINNNNNIGRNGSFFNVAGYLIEERRRWPIINASHEDNVLNKFRIWKERHIQMRKTVPVTLSDEKLILLYCPGRGSNSRPTAHRSFKHGQGVPRSYPLGHGGGFDFIYRCTCI